MTLYFALPWVAALQKNSIMMGNENAAKEECVSDNSGLALIGLMAGSVT